MKTEIRCLPLMDTDRLLHMTESARLSHRKTRTATPCLLLMVTDRRIHPASRKTLQKFNREKTGSLIGASFLIHIHVVSADSTLSFSDWSSKRLIS